MAFYPVIASVMVLCVLVGCEHTPLNQSGNIRSIQIQDTIQPAVLYAQVGDEIRWQNLSNEVVHLRFLGTPNWEIVTCEKGFRWMGLMQDSATIKPKEFVSLCVSKPSTLRFNVWMDWENSQSKISPTLTVHVEARGGTDETLSSKLPRKSSQPASVETPRLGVDSFAPKAPLQRP